MALGQPEVEPLDGSPSCEEQADALSVGPEPPASNVGVEGSDSEGSRIDDIYSNIKNMITLLYRILIAIRPARRQESSQEYSELDLHHWEPYDDRHVADKFPAVMNNSSQFLLKRLARANTERRKFFQYQKAHREKLARSCKNIEAHDFEAREFEAPEGTVLTKVSTLQDLRIPPTSVPDADEFVFETEDMEVNSDGGCTQTSYAPTSLFSKDTGLHNLSVPPPNADRAYCGEPFECPYCRYPITVANVRSWQ